MEQCGGEICQDKLDFSQLSWQTGKGRNGWGSLGWFSLFTWAAIKLLGFCKNEQREINLAPAFMKW